MDSIIAWTITLCRSKSLNRLPIQWRILLIVFQKCGNFHLNRHKIKISIITPCLNRAGLIPDAIESVLAQDYPEFEHIIMDGGSTDDTLSILSRYSHLKVFSGKDTGMYAALNKGLEQAQGEIIGLLNSDDEYAPAVFGLVIEQFQRHPQADVVSGMASYFSQQDGNRSTLKVFACVTQESFERRLMYGVPIINAWFFRRSVFDRLGHFDQSFLIAADRDFQARCLIHAVHLQPVGRLFYHYRHHQDSMTVNSDLEKQETYLSEELKLARKFSDGTLASRRLRSRFMRWQDIILFDLVISNLRRHNFIKALKWLVSAVREKPGRLILFALHFPSRLVKYLLRITVKAGNDTIYE